MHSISPVSVDDVFIHLFWQGETEEQDQIAVDSQGLP